MTGAGRFVAVVSQIRPVLRGRLLTVLPVGDGLPFAEHARGDREGGMDERDVDLAILVGAPPDERQGGDKTSTVAEVLARGSVG
jgi:hypothetical protein